MQLAETEQAVTLTPQSEINAVVIWLHGLGADGYDFEPIVPEMDLPAGHGIRFVFPHAPHRPITINNGYVMRGWYDIREPDLSRREDEPGIRESAASIEALIDSERTRYGLPASRILLAGFSQGGAIALHTGLRYPEPVAGVLALSAYVPLSGTLASERHSANLEVPIFMAHGDHDPVIALAQAQASREQLVQLGYRVDWHSYAMEHSVVPEEIDDIGRWLRRRLVTD
ncbi:MAG: alpha/beta hydrolase-fold protein [Granulosicoccaceae bacterium]|jgi:phospholipase/carboxylesterase